MAQQLTMSTIAALPWTGEAGLSAHYDSLAFATQRQIRDRAATVRLDANAGIHLLGDEIIHLGPAGDRSGSTPLPLPPDRILDFCCDAKGLTLLLVRDVDAGAPQLTLLNPDGTVGWTQHAAGNADGLRFRGGPVAFVTDVYGRVAEIDMITGDVRQTIALRDGAGRVFDAGDLLMFVYLDERSNLLGVAAVGPAGEPGWALAASDELHTWLADPIGADGSGRLYVWRDGLVARLSGDGVPEILGTPPTGLAGTSPDSWQVDGTGVIVAAVPDLDGVTIVRVASP